MSTLAELKDWVTKMLELEGKATPAPWGSICQESNCHNPADCRLTYAARNSFRPLLTMTLEQIKAVEKCRKCNTLGMVPGIRILDDDVPCHYCGIYRASLERLAQQVLEGK